MTMIKVDEHLPALNLAKVEEAMLQLPQAECPVEHIFGPGLYIRQVSMQAGIIALGHMQKHPHMNSFVKGRVLMLNEDGTTRELVAPMTFLAGPGRKIGLILEDVVWQNIYPTDERDVEALEAYYLDKTAASLNAYALSNEAREDDREDFLKVLEEFGLTAEQVREESELTDDLMPMPYGFNRTAVFSSGIEGKGLFATANIKAGEIICPALFQGKRTPAGRYANHAKFANAGALRMDNGDVVLVALYDIQGCIGGFAGEEITVDYRQILEMRLVETISQRPESAGTHKEGEEI
jgi:hypothetical protein